MIKILFLYSLINFSFAQTTTELTTDSFKEIETKALEYGHRFGHHNVLIVLDIDNTLLTMPQNFGSDQWFNWQYENCIGKKKMPDFCITSSMGEFLDLQGQLFALSDMNPSDDHVVKVVNNLQNKGFKVILLTSRGPEFRSATQRVIKKNNMDFRKRAIGPKDGYAATYRPYELNNLKPYGITKDEAIVADLKTSRDVSYQNGIFMGSGQHKGIMLKTLLKKTNTHPRGIIFADDHEKHTQSMQAIFGKRKNISLTTFHYTKIDPVVEKFNKSKKQDVIQDYKSFKEMKEIIFK
ncbi:MAG: hypothetical protein CME62_05785 [Halobacteriovoraceae bacterium]|nr:hypothetical protein [Halobacteriovoraceae bacterium]|tara:strand:- start:20661 stop:21542 length:882 start_codon:yes stop_codon:yes gene_type:complete